jgi:hypothetical protein
MPPVTVRALGASLLLTSCTVGPDFAAPELKLPGRWKQSSATEAATPAPDTWWTLFRDSELNSLVDRALAGNQELAGALARVQSARALSQIERAGWFPQLGILNTTTFERLSAKSVGANLPSGASLPELERDRYRLFLDLNYELDLWGRVRRGVEGARAREQAQRDLVDAQRLIVAAEVARHHFLTASLEAQGRILKETVALRQEALDLQNSRFQGGLANEMDVARARTELELTRADLVAIERQRGSLEHALAVLCGEPPADFQKQRSARLPAPPRVPAGLPSTVLQARTCALPNRTCAPPTPPSVSPPPTSSRASASSARPAWKASAPRTSCRAAPRPPTSVRRSPCRSSRAVACSAACAAPAPVTRRPSPPTSKPCSPPCARLRTPCSMPAPSSASAPRSPPPSPPPRKPPNSRACATTAACRTTSRLSMPSASCWPPASARPNSTASAWSPRCRCCAPSVAAGDHQSAPGGRSLPRYQASRAGPLNTQIMAPPAR